MLYIIGGPAKSGKTTLRKKFLIKKGFSGISTDYLRAMLQKEESLHIRYKNTPEENHRNMEKFLGDFME